MSISFYREGGSFTLPTSTELTRVKIGFELGALENLCSIIFLHSATQSVIESATWELLRNADLGGHLAGTVR